MNEIMKLWEEVKNLLHAPTNTKPLWQAVIDQMHAFEARLAALETGLQTKINALVANAEALFQDNISQAMQAEFNQLVSGFEARIAALEEKLVLMSTPSEPAPPVPTQAGGQLPPPTEQIIHPDTPAAESATESSAAGENTGPDSPTVQPSPEGAGPDNPEKAKEEGHDSQ